MGLYSLLAQQGPPDTMAYMVAGYVIIFGVIAVYLISLVVRTRNLKRDYEVLEELEEEKKQ